MKFTRHWITTKKKSRAKYIIPKAGAHSPVPSPLFYPFPFSRNQTPKKLRNPSRIARVPRKKVSKNITIPILKYKLNSQKKNLPPHPLSLRFPTPFLPSHPLHVIDLYPFISCFPVSLSFFCCCSYFHLFPSVGRRGSHFLASAHMAIFSIFSNVLFFLYFCCCCCSPFACKWFWSRFPIRAATQQHKKNATRSHRTENAHTKGRASIPPPPPTHQLFWGRCSVCVCVCSLTREYGGEEREKGVLKWSERRGTGEQQFATRPHKLLQDGLVKKWIKGGC